MLKQKRPLLFIPIFLLLMMAFTVTNEDGGTFGPFTLADASQAYQFDVDIVATQLRFDAAATNSGNTGFIELAAYGTVEN